MDTVKREKFFESFSVWLERKKKFLVSKLDVVSVPEKVAKDKNKLANYMYDRFKKGC